MVQRGSGQRTVVECCAILLLGLVLSSVACSSDDSGGDDSAGGSETDKSHSSTDGGTANKPPTKDAAATGVRPSDGGSAPAPSRDAATTTNRVDAGGGDQRGDAANPTTGGDAATDGDATSASAPDAAVSSDGSAPASAVPSDYTQRGPHQVVTEKNVGKDFRNTNVTDQSAFCRSFVGGISLPGEGNVDEELTNYPADMDRQLYTLFRPAEMGEGAKYPVITWGNGTCAQPLLYSEILEHLASWGFIIIASNSTSTGSGREMLRGVDFVLKENTTEGSALFGHVETAMVGASGHSQGSGGSIAAGADARIKVTVPIQGASAAGVRALKGPTFLISGEKDTLVTPSGVMTAFNAVTTLPAVYGMSIGQDHLMPGRMPMPILKAVTSWFRIHLSNDDAARPVFYGNMCELCSDRTWTIMRKNL